jgi:tetratricopeptide (TPR) repeat protein
LGTPPNPAAVQDPALRQAAHLTLAEVCFALAFRKLTLSPELGHPNLIAEAAAAAYAADRPAVASLIRQIGAVIQARPEERVPALGVLAQDVARAPEALEPWLLVEIGGQIVPWVEELENAMPAGDNPRVLAKILPPFYDALRLPDREQRKARLYRRAIQILMRAKRHADALAILETLPQRNPALEAACLQALGEFRRAAEAYRAAGDLKEALSCYRSIPDFDAAWALISELPDHPAAESYQWLTRLRQLVAQRPEKFTRVMLPSEKKLLEEILEQALGAQRRKPVPRKPAAGKTAPARAPRKPPVPR